MNVEVLKIIIDETVNSKGKEKLLVYYGDRWKEHKSVKEDVKKRKINTDGLIAVVKQNKVDFKIYFYETGMFFNTDRMFYAYDDILHGGSKWNLEKNYYNHELGLLATKEKVKEFFITHNFNSFIGTFCRKVIEERFCSDNGKTTEWYLNLSKQYMSNDSIEIGKTCIDYALRYQSDNEEALKFNAGVDIRIATKYLAYKVNVLKTKICTPKDKRESYKRYLGNVRTLFENAEKHGFEEAYLCHLSFFLKHIHSCKEADEICEQTRFLARKYLELKASGNIELKTEKMGILNVLLSNTPRGYWDRLGRAFYFYRHIQDYKMSIAFCELSLSDCNAEDSNLYAEIKYIMSLCYRDGLGGKEKSSNEQLNCLLEAANRGYGRAEYELYKLYHKLGDEETAEGWRAKAKSHGIKDEAEYRMSFAELFDDVVGIDGFTKIMNAVGEVIEPAAKIVSGAAEITCTIMSATTDIKTHRTAQAKEKAEQRRVAYEMEEDILEHIRRLDEKN